MFELGATDSARHLMLKRSSVKLRDTVSRLTSELASGEVSDKTQTLKGALGHLAYIENSISLMKQNLSTAKFASTILEAQQSVVSNLGKISQDLAHDLTISAQTPDTLLLHDARARAESGFRQVTALLNTKVAGRYLFSGTSGDVRPFADPDLIMNALVSSLPPYSSAADIKTHVENWFNVGGDFETVAYLGEDATSIPLDLGNQNALRFDVTGKNPAMRATLAGLALGAIGEHLIPTTTEPVKRELLAMSANLLFASDTARVALQSSIGAKEAQVSEARTSAEARSTILQIARNDLLASDPYDVATALEAATQKMDALYLVTARLSRLSLTEYLR